MTRARWACAATVVLAMTASLAQGAADGEAFEDVTAQSGIDFRHVNGAFGDKWMPESLGSGVALFDADGDGWTDVLLVQGGPWPGHEDAVEADHRDATMRLYRNLGGLQFEDVTATSGLEVPMYGFAAAPADYDGDGDLDVYVTAYGTNRMFRNDGSGQFSDVTADSGLGHDGWGTSAAWFDYDQDGDLDLYLANYVRWTPDADIWCSLDGSEKSYCTPESYEGEPSVLFRNEGDGSFTDVSRMAGVFVPGGKSLGIALTDVDRDGWLDFAVANDTEPNFLFRNKQDGTFEEIGLLSGMAFDASGRARAGMGIDTADLKNTGDLSLAIGNFSKEMIGLFELQPGGIFIDVAAQAGIGRSSFPFLTFGLFFFDYDLDGWLDMFAANGHLEDRIAEIEASISYEQRPLLYRNRGDGSFVDAAANEGALARPIVGRGAAYADLDRDGDLDVVITTNDGPVTLLENTARGERTDGANVLRIDLRHQDGRTPAIGAVVEVVAGDWQQRQMVRSGSSYASQSEFALTFGLGDRTTVDAVRIQWPGGESVEVTGDTLNGVVGHELVWHQAAGILERIPLTGARR